MLKTDGVIWHTAISLDGYAADVNDSLAFMARYEAPNPVIDEVEANIGCTLGGRRGYDVFRAWEEEPQAYGDAVQVPEYVVTRRPFPDDPKTLFADGNDLPAAVARAKATANGRMVVILGPTLGSALLCAGLVDQVVLHVTPVLIGAGVRIFADTAEPPVHLKLIHLRADHQHGPRAKPELVPRHLPCGGFAPIDAPSPDRPAKRHAVAVFECDKAQKARHKN